MGRKPKTQAEAPQQTSVEPVTEETVNQAETTIIPDTPPVYTKSSRAGKITGDTAKVRNRKTGVINTLSAKAAARLARDTDNYEIVD